MCFQDLFKRVVPHRHQCLGAVWSRRDKSRDHDAATVATCIFLKTFFFTLCFRQILIILVFFSPSS